MTTGASRVRSCPSRCGEAKSESATAAQSDGSKRSGSRWATVPEPPGNGRCRDAGRDGEEEDPGSVPEERAEEPAGSLHLSRRRVARRGDRGQERAERSCGPAPIRPISEARRRAGDRPEHRAPVAPPDHVRRDPDDQLRFGDRRGESQGKTGGSGLVSSPEGIRGGQPKHRDSVPLTLQEEQPGAEAREGDQDDRHARQARQRRRPRRGARHEPGARAPSARAATATTPARRRRPRAA